MKKVIFIGVVIFSLATIFNQMNDHSIVNVRLDNLNALAMADDEGGSSNYWKCYSTYDNCSFWCDTIYRCGNPCTSVEADDQSDSDWCYNN